MHASCQTEDRRASGRGEREKATVIYAERQDESEYAKCLSIALSLSVA